MTVRKRFNAYDIQTMAPMEKIGIIATQNTQGQPHITFINSLMATDPTRMALGQFIRGKSKYFFQKHPPTTFFILSPQARKTWQGKLIWTGKKDQGAELEMFKEKPLQRYNSYFPIHRVHYFDLVETSPATSLPLLKMAGSALMTRLVGSTAPGSREKTVLNTYGKALVESPLTFKFLSFVGRDGFPCLIPFISCMTAGPKSVVFPQAALKNHPLKDNLEMALFCLKPTLESVLVRGKFMGWERILGVKMGRIDLDWVYNSMPPNAGQIYPQKPLTPVTIFD